MEDGLLAEQPHAPQEAAASSAPAPSAQPALALRAAGVALLGYLCVGELLPPPLTADFVELAGLPPWEVQQLVLLALLCALAAAAVALDGQRPTAGATANAAWPALWSDEDGMKRVFAVAHAVPLALSVLAALWRMKSDNCPTDEPPCGTMETGLDAIGLMSARCARLDLALCLLPAAKESLWLLVLGGPHDYSSAMPLHQLSGWWCAAQSGLHSVAYLIFYLSRGGLHELWVTCFPVPLASQLNSLG